MLEVLWHGRGGQGAFTAARLLGAAAMEAGLEALAFPSFGPERRGAPMRAFTKIAGAGGGAGAARDAEAGVGVEAGAGAGASGGEGVAPADAGVDEVAGAGAGAGGCVAGAGAGAEATAGAGAGAEARKIGNRSACTRANIVVYLDDTLFGEGWADELLPGGRAVVNSTRAFDDPRIFAVDADALSTAALGRPIPNTVLLGAVSALCGRIEIAHIEAAIRSNMAPKLQDANIALARQAAQLAAAAGGSEGAAGVAIEISSGTEGLNEGAARVASGASNEGAAKTADDVGSETAGEGATGAEPARTETDVRDVAGSAGNGAAAGDGAAHSPANTQVAGTAEADRVAEAAGAAAGTIGAAEAAHLGAFTPKLREHFAAALSLDPFEYSQTTCFAAGHLVQKNAGWRNVRPVVDAGACTGCGQCYLYCPDGTVVMIEPVAAGEGAAAGAVTSASANSGAAATTAAATAANASANSGAAATTAAATAANAGANSAATAAATAAANSAATAAAAAGANSAANAATAAATAAGANSAATAAAAAGANSAANATTTTAAARKRRKHVAAIDYDFCKGCGICAKICPVDAISMQQESRFCKK